MRINNESDNEQGEKERMEPGDGAEEGEKNAFDEEDCLAKIEELAAQKDYAGAAALEAARCERIGVLAKQNKDARMDRSKGKNKSKSWNESKGRGKGKGKDLAKAMRSTGKQVNEGKGKGPVGGKSKGTQTCMGAYFGDDECHVV